jgi:hypothetical protein
MYVEHLVDAPGKIYHGDCQWVLDSFELGRYLTTRGSAVHADLWRKFWAAHDKRAHPILVCKVKAHATAQDIAAGYPELWLEGNSFADAGAKKGRLIHPTSAVMVQNAQRIWLLVQTTARFIARVHESAMLAALDVPPFDRRIARRPKSKAERKPPRHAIVAHGDRSRCLWCLRTTEGNGSYIREECIQAAQH